MDADGNQYKLVITEDGARAAVAGDSYRLEITFTNGSVKISVGKVSSVTTNGAFELQPSASGAEPFTVAVSGTEIAAITGEITVEGGETVPAPTFPNNNGGGTLTITGIPENYRDCWFFASVGYDRVTIFAGDDDGFGFGASGFYIKGGKQGEGSSVTLKVWVIDHDNGQAIPYSRTEELEFIIELTYPHELMPSYKATIPFTNGSATIDWSSLSRI